VFRGNVLTGFDRINYSKGLFSPGAKCKLVDEIASGPTSSFASFLLFFFVFFRVVTPRCNHFFFIFVHFFFLEFLHNGVHRGGTQYFTEIFKFDSLFIQLA